MPPIRMHHMHVPSTGDATIVTQHAKLLRVYKFRDPKSILAYCHIPGVSASVEALLAVRSIQIVWRNI